MVPSLCREQPVERVETSHPHHHGEEGVQVDEDGLDQRLYTRPHPSLQPVLGQVNQDLDGEADDVEGEGRTPSLCSGVP